MGNHRLERKNGTAASFNGTNIQIIGRSSECRIWVKNGSRGLAAGCLLCPRERTSSGCLGTSEKCHDPDMQVQTFEQAIIGDVR